VQSAVGGSSAEPPPVAPAVVAAGLLIAQQVAGKATRDAFFLSQFDVTTLPLMSGAAAILSLLAVLAFARGMAALAPGRMVPLGVAVSASLINEQFDPYSAERAVGPIGVGAGLGGIIGA